MLSIAIRLTLILLLLPALGCQIAVHRDPAPTISLPPEIPRELCKSTIPEYLIEPPDILTIDAVRLLPRQPYSLHPLDTLAVQVMNSENESLFQASVAIDPSGRLPLGPQFGYVEVEGRTIEEVRDIVSRRVAETYADPLVTVDIVQLELLQQIAGEHLVKPDGKIGLGVYGQVRVAGMSIPQATDAIETHLRQYLDDPKVAIDVFAFNSKFYYVISEGGGLGDQVDRFPFTGNETVLDAISNVEGLSAVSSKKMWIARPGRNDQGGEQILPVDWQAISKRGDIATNFQLLPGDRVFIAEDQLVARDNHLAKLVAPFERLAGVTILITNAVQRLVFFKETARGVGVGGF